MKPRTNQSGQVLIVGIAMILILLLSILLLFDVHNVLRGKFKVETAQQSAALTGAEWQRESLNLIGEINLIKACETLLDNSVYWPDHPAGAPEDPDRLRGRLDLLTEMQTRVSFIGPLIGFAAAQQSAKANGLNPQDNLTNYTWLLENDWRYREAFGGAADVIRNYRWRAPYTQMIRDIGARGIAIYPNARLSSNPVVEPAELASEDLYINILEHAAEIQAGIPVRDQLSWHDKTYQFVRKWRQSDFANKWWNIDYSMARFPEESEIFTLGVEFNSTAGNFTEYRHELQQFVPSQKVYGQDTLPPGMGWCRYDDFWYPEYYRARYTGYDDDHFNAWFGGTMLREPVKQQYRYEGAAAYVEGCVKMDSLSRFRVRKGKSADLDRLYDAGIRSTQIGTRRHGSASSAPALSDYRPGAIAKVLGALRGNLPPIAIPLILPVFEQTSLMPTYMPLPYGFGVLRPGSSLQEQFLNWLTDTDSLFDYRTEPPPETAEFLKALQILCEDRDFRRYGYNPDFDNAEIDRKYAERPKELLKEWKFCYDKVQMPDGAGWLQLPQNFTVLYSETPQEAGNVVAVTDFINGGMAQRIYSDPMQYYVIDSRGHVVTNDESDPTQRYGALGGGGSYPGYGGISQQPDLQEGPPRL